MFYTNRRALQNKRCLSGDQSCCWSELHMSGPTEKRDLCWRSLSNQSTLLDWPRRGPHKASLGRPDSVGWVGSKPVLSYSSIAKCSFVLRYISFTYMCVCVNLCPPHACRCPGGQKVLDFLNWNCRNL